MRTACKDKPARLLWATLVVAMVALSLSAEGQDKWFGIQVVDSVTRRGVPMVELKTGNKQIFMTDSNGWIALNEPGWAGQEIYFHIRSHGYEYRKDGFGYAGKALKIESGGRVEIPLKRINIAERLYRITGEGIYRDSVLLGIPVPLARPTINAKVEGQDTVFAAPYHDRIFWLWGDTGRLAYPLGNFRTSSAVSQLPSKGGLDPSAGVDLTYFENENGFCKSMCPMPEEKDGLIWMSALAAVPDRTGRERLVGRYTRIKGFCNVVSHGIATFNDETEVFDQSKLISMDEKWRHPEGHPLHFKDGDGVWILFTTAGLPCVRTRPTYEAIHDLDQYEAFTCLEDGAIFDKERTRLSHDEKGGLNWRWTRDAPPLTQEQERELVHSGLMTKDGARFQFADADGNPVEICQGSVHWNEYLKAYILIGQQKFGTSPFGEIWFGTAESPVGPWSKVVKVVTHDDYTFYNVVQHGFFDREGGRLIHFEGTYTQTFSGSKVPTPRYDYNQIMYRLDLSDPRLRAALRR
jgi:hypothetical protein